MPTLDARPGRLDGVYRPGSSFTVTLTGPAGWLDSRVFTATLGGTALVVAEDGDDLIVTASAVVTTAHPSGAQDLVITETGGNAEIVGKWVPRTSGSTHENTEATVIIDDLNVAVSILGIGAAPTDVAYLVATASNVLSAEVVVGASPGGELGGTWASPTVDATHSGSSHAAVQAAAEATAAAALTTHAADTTAVHGIADTSLLLTHAGAANGTDDTTALQALLTAARVAGGGIVKGKPGEDYEISDPLVIGSNTTLDMTGCTVTLLAGSNCNMLNSYAMTSGVRDTNVAVRGGHWDRGANGGSGTDQHSLVFREVDGLIVRDLHVTQTNGKYFINPADCTDVLVEDITSDVSSATFQCAGPISRMTVRNIHGYAADDMVAITPTDWPAYDDSHGDVTDVLIENISGETDQVLVKVLGGATGAAERVVIRDVFGSADGVSLLWVGDDAGHANTTGGLIDDLTVENIHGTVPNGSPLVFINGTNMGTVTLEGLHFDNVDSSASVVLIDPATTCTFHALHVHDVYVKALPNRPVVHQEADAPITTVVIDGVHVQSGGGVSVISANAAIGNLEIRNVKIETSTGGAVANLGAAITRLLIDGVQWASASGSSRLVEVRADVTVADLTVANVTHTGAGGYALYLNSATAAVTRTTFSNVHLVGVAGLVSAVTSTHVLPAVELLGCTLSGCAWIADLNITTTVLMAGVHHASPSSGSFNIRASGVVTVRGAGCSIAGSLTNAGSFTNGSLDLASVLPANVALDTTTGTKIGTATSQKLGFFNATPIVQPSAANARTALQNLGLGASLVPEVTAKWVPAAAFTLSNGTPNLNGTLAVTYWAFDAAALEQVMATVEIPPGWTTFDVDLWWANHSTGAGDVRWGLRYDPALAAGVVADTGATVAHVTATASTTAGLTIVTTIASGLTAASLVPMGVRRTGADAADTLGNDARLFGLMLRRAS